MADERTAVPGHRPQPALSLFGGDWDYWFDRDTWSSLMAFLLLSSGVLLIALPSSIDVGRVTPRSFEFTDLFIGLYVILFGILAITQGQAEISWDHRLKTRALFIHQMSRQMLGVLLGLPFWIIFIFANIISPATVFGVVVHFALVGFVLGFFGWRLALTHQSEIYQFNIKYLLFFGFLFATYFVPALRFLNPIWPLASMLGDGISLSAQAMAGFYLSWSALGLLLAYGVFRMLRAEAQEMEGYEDELSRYRA